MTTKVVFLTGIMSMFLSSGCSLGIGESDADGKVNADAAGFYNSMIASVSTSEQQRLFGPFPSWRMQEGSYHYKLFAMHYLINNDKGVRDVQKSWVAALYFDVELPNRYMLKFSIRSRSSEDLQNALRQGRDLQRRVRGLLLHAVRIVLDENAVKRGRKVPGLRRRDAAGEGRVLLFQALQIQSAPDRLLQRAPRVYQPAGP